jgi:hypothetical protein
MRHGVDVGPHPLIRNSAIAGGISASVVLAILRLDYLYRAGYWDRWSAFLPSFTGNVVFALLIGAVIGAIVGFIWGVASQDTTL